MFTQYSHVYVHEYILYNLKNSKLLFKAVIIEKKWIEVKIYWSQVFLIIHCTLYNIFD